MKFKIGDEVFFPSLPVLGDWKSIFHDGIKINTPYKVRLVGTHDFHFSQTNNVFAFDGYMRGWIPEEAAQLWSRSEGWYKKGTSFRYVTNFISEDEAKYSEWVENGVHKVGEGVCRGMGNYELVGFEDVKPYLKQNDFEIGKWFRFKTSNYQLGKVEEITDEYLVVRPWICNENELVSSGTFSLDSLEDITEISSDDPIIQKYLPEEHPNKIEDLVEGNYYYIHIKKERELIVKVKKLNTKPNDIGGFISLGPMLQIRRKDFAMDGRFCGKASDRTFKLATKEEKEWLDRCIEANRFLPKDSKHTKEQLIYKAQERGFVAGVSFRDLVHGDLFFVNNPVEFTTYQADSTLYIFVKGNNRGNKSACIYKNGVWAKLNTSAPLPTYTQKEIEAKASALEAYRAAFQNPCKKVYIPNADDYTYGDQEGSIKVNTKKPVAAKFNKTEYESQSFNKALSIKTKTQSKTIQKLNL